MRTHAGRLESLPSAVLIDRQGLLCSPTTSTNVSRISSQLPEVWKCLSPTRWPDPGLDLVKFDEKRVRIGQK